MAYFTRDRMILMSYEMYVDNKRFLNGATGNDAEDLQVLIACQQKALALGEYLESLGTDYSDIVAMFERYCNHIYEIAENLNNDAIVDDNYTSIMMVLSDIINAIENRVVEISSIDIYDFSNLADTPREKKLISNEINRLFDDCLISTGDYEESFEYNVPLVVGSY